MMNQKKSNRWMMLKALFVIPVATLAVSVFANTTDMRSMAKAANTTANSISTNNMQTKQSDKKIYKVVEEMPQFKGGDAKLMEFLMMNMKYPESAIKAKQQGRAVVGFVVGKDGTVSDVYIEKSTGYDVLDNEAMRVVKSMPAWEPGKQKGKPVDVKYFVPITFRQK